VWNGPWDFTDEPALKMWDKILQSGRHITAIASSDSHRPDTPIGQPSTHVAMPVLSQQALLKALRSGHVFLSDGSGSVVLSFEAEPATRKTRSRAAIGDQVRLLVPGKVRFFVKVKSAPTDATVSLISNGEVIRRFDAKPDGEPQVIEIDCRRDAYFRLEVRARTNVMLVLTNPIYIKIAETIK